MRLPDLNSSIDSTGSVTVEWKKNLELITKRRERNVSLPKVEMLRCQVEPNSERKMDVFARINQVRDKIRRIEMIDDEVDYERQNKVVFADEVLRTTITRSP